MNHPEAAIESAFYDHELQDEPRAAADWGADEVFATVPRRRRFDRGIRHGTLTAVPARPATAPRTRGDHVVPAAPPSPAPDAEPVAEYSPPPADTGRKTVVITGRPEGELRPAIRRERPPQTLSTRLGPRPDRVAGWAFAMGMLLILIAIGTA